MRGSEALCQLLRYLAERSLTDPSSPVREHQIATGVFGRADTFDPRTDSTVRVQTSRLRGKLSEYYATAGRLNPWHIEIPKGTYSVVFHPRPVAEPAPLPPPPVPETAPGWRTRFAPLGIALILLLVLLAGWWTLYLTLRPAEVLSHSATGWFWHGMLRGQEEPLAVFSNAEFVGRPETGIRYRKPGEVPGPIFDQYTGIGEVFAIHNLDRVFFDLHRHYMLKRGRLLNWDDTKGRDLIFVGSPSENLPLRQLPVNRDFVFSRADSGPRAGDLGILNFQPQPGEDKMYFGSPSIPIQEDYAVVELGWAGSSSRSVLLLAGTTTFGTEAAAEFVASEDKLRDIRQRLSDSPNLPSFSAVIHVQVQGGVALDSSIVAFRRH
jgi:hypothetical protein